VDEGYRTQSPRRMGQRVDDDLAFGLRAGVGGCVGEDGDDWDAVL
jgi:hypothetical protein